MSTQHPPGSPVAQLPHEDRTADPRALRIVAAPPGAITDTSKWPAQIEYEQAHEWWRHLSNMRRQDLAMFTTIQGAALTLIGDHLLSLDPPGLGLSIVAFLVALIGLNNERRLYSYLVGFRERALELERSHGADLIARGMRQAQNSSLLINTQMAFGSYYGLLAAGWMLIWILNVT